MLLSDTRINLDQEAASWQEAVELAGKLLETDGLTTSAYTEAMQAAITEFGPYVVILPGFALCHAAPSAAVLDNGASLITLKTPVNFSSENDPVKIVMALCSKDGSSHMKNLEGIATRLMVEGALEAIASAKTAEDVLSILQPENRGE